MAAMTGGTEPARLAARTQAITERIRAAGGDPASIRIVAVTKGFGPEAVRAAAAAGLTDLGENYAQELSAKAMAAPEGTRWHFLGPVQRNKVARLAPLVSLWHGLDRERAIDALAAHRPGAEVLLQLNPFGDPRKQGCVPEALPSLAERCRERGLDLRGLMVIGPEGDLAGTRGAFRMAASWGRKLGLPELSMGMTDDFEIAVGEGATILRLGRVIFGPRPQRQSVQR